MGERTARIIQFPLNDRYCGNCEHGCIGNFGVYCDELRIPIWDEKEARICDAFRRNERGK